MRYQKEHKDKTRQRVIEAASVRFRRDGLDGVGVATLMGEAGLTHGGFYSHFPSKEALVEEVIAYAMETNFDNITKAAEGQGIEGFIRHYLRPAHREHPEKGCLAAALGSEIWRHSKSSRKAFTDGLQRSIDHIMTLLPKPDMAVAESIFATLMGTLQLARNVADPVMATRLLKSGEAAALALAKSV